MQPTDKIVFVKEVEKEKDNIGEFETNRTYTAYQVTAVGKEVSLCKKGDFVWFMYDTTYKFEPTHGILAVSADNILGVEHA